MSQIYFDTLKRRVNIYTKRNLKFDVMSGFVVFLVAIPLCLGIALASGASLYSGILSGIIGGIVVGTISNSQVSVSGPAAGMAAVVLTTITQLGDFNTFLLALTIAGVLQLALGIFKVGFLSDYIPSNVIQGLLAAIGILLIIKQLPFAFTLSSDINEMKLHLLEANEGLDLNLLTNFIYHLNVGAIIISSLSFALLIYFDRTKIKTLQSVPAPIIVVLLGIILNTLFTYFNLNIAQNYPHLVNLPEFNGFTGFLKQFEFPNWYAFKNPEVYLYAVLICAIASIESLLNIKASEKIDKKHRYTSKNLELIAQGAGNTLAGLIGAIPVTSVIVRTSVNVQSGARTKLSTILHSVFLFIAILTIPDLLNKIPLSSLAAILIFIGYKLTKISIYKSIYKQGIDRFIPFIATIIGIIVFNLLAGVVIGLMLSLLYILKANSQVRLDIIKEQYPNGVTCRLVLPQQITFLSKAALTQELDSISNNSQFIIDATYSDFIDKEILELIKEFKEHQAENKNITLSLIGFKQDYKIHNYINFIPVTTYEVQAELHPAQVFSLLKEGNERFFKDFPIQRNAKIDAKYSPKKQFPIAVIISCIDTHVPIETIFDMGFGDIYCIRVGANIINQDIQANLEYACNLAGAKLIVILGHSACGVIEAIYKNNQSKKYLNVIRNKLLPIIEKVEETTKVVPLNSMMQKIISYNLAQTILEIYKNTKIRKLIDEDNVGIIGGIYDAKTRKVSFESLKKELNELGNHKDEQLIKNINSLINKAKNYNKSSKNPTI